MPLTWMSVEEVLLLNRCSQLGEDSCICLVALSDFVEVIGDDLCIYNCWRYML